MSLPPEAIAADNALSGRRSGVQRREEPIELTEAELTELAEWQAEDREIQARIAKRKQEAAEKREEATHKLRVWANAHSRRDEFIREAHTAGLSVHRIHRITGVARTTIMRILDEP